MKESAILFLFFCASLILKAQVYNGTNAESIVTGSQKVWLNDSTHSIKFVKLKNDYTVNASEQTTWLSQILHLPAGFSLVLSGTEKDTMNYKHYRYRFSINNIGVADYMYIVHVSHNKVVSANGDFTVGKVLNTTPSVTETQAFQSAINYFGAQTYLWQVDSTITRPVGELIYVPLNGNFVLSYGYTINSTEPVKFEKVFVNAVTDTVIRSYNCIISDNQPGTAVTKYSGTRTITTDRVVGSPTYYKLEEYNIGYGGQMQGIETWNMQTATSPYYYTAVKFQDDDNYWNNVNQAQDEVATDVHWGVERAYDYFWTKFNRNSWDDDGMLVKSYVHYGKRCI